MHVWQETVHADFQQHDESSAHILPHFWLLVCRQREQVLQKVETGGQRGCIFPLTNCAVCKTWCREKGKLTGLN